jgi:hypothetical protein
MSSQVLIFFNQFQGFDAFSNSVVSLLTVSQWLSLEEPIGEERRRGRDYCPSPAFMREKNPLLLTCSRNASDM